MPLAPPFNALAGLLIESWSKTEAIIRATDEKSKHLNQTPRRNRTQTLPRAGIHAIPL